MQDSPYEGARTLQVSPKSTYIKIHFPRKVDEIEKFLVSTVGWGEGEAHMLLFLLHLVVMQCLQNAGSLGALEHKRVNNEARNIWSSTCLRTRLPFWRGRGTKH